MSLFTDSSLINISDLEIYESTLSKIASTHNINIESKTAITLAAIGDRLLERLVRAGGVNNPWFNPVNTGRYNFVALPPLTSWCLTLDNVVVTGLLKRWICYELLSQVFSEAYNVQLNDRFKEKWMDYARRADTTEQSVYDLGIGVVYKPLAQPGLAQVSLNSGALPAGIVTVQTTWVDAQGHEGSASLLVPVTLPDSSSFTVSVVAAGAAIPSAAVGWNVYVSANGSAAALQNAATISLNTTWTVPGTGFTTGRAPSAGQQPDCYVLDPQRLWRG